MIRLCHGLSRADRSWPPSMSSASQILERDSELDRIADALDSAAAGNGRVLVIEGQAGIGKTRLVREARDLAHARGFARLQAVGDEAETAMSWGVVRQMVERSVSRYRGEVREAILAGPAGAALRALDEAPVRSPRAARPTPRSRAPSTRCGGWRSTCPPTGRC